MADEQFELNAAEPAKMPGQRLLVDTSSMTVRRITRNEATIMTALRTLAPVERATLTSFVDMLHAKKRRNRKVQQEAA